MNEKKWGLIRKTSQLPPGYIPSHEQWALPEYPSLPRTHQENQEKTGKATRNFLYSTLIPDPVRTKTGEIKELPIISTDEHGDSMDIAQPDDNARMRINKESYWKVPENFLDVSGVHTYQLEPKQPIGKTDSEISRIMWKRRHFALPSDWRKSTYPWLSSNTKQNNENMNARNENSNKDCVIPLSCLHRSFCHFFLRYNTMSGQTPTMLATSTSDGICSSFVMITRRKLECEMIQSWCSAPLRRLMMNSLIEKGSKQPNTDDATFWRHPFSSRKTKIWYSINLSAYPLPKYSAYV